MILAIFNKEKILTENGKGRIHHLSVGSGLAKENALVIFAQHDEGNTYVYAYARLVEQEEFDQWHLSTIRPFVAERQLLHESKIQDLESDAVHFLHDSLPVTKTLEKMCIDNASIELEIAYNILNENLWMSDLLLSDRRITPQYTDQDLLRSAYQMADEVRAFAEQMSDFEHLFESSDITSSEEKNADLEQNIIDILTEDDE